METPFVSINNRNGRSKTLAIVALAVIGTLAACYVVVNTQATESTLVQVNPTALYDLYSHWKSTYGYRYGSSGSEEDKARFSIFSENYQIILNHNLANNASYKLGLNQFAALTSEEYSAIYLGYKADETLDDEVDFEILPTDNLADAIDWEAKGAVTPVKNQGQCGSCWAFSTTGALEGLNFVKNGDLLSFSEQQLVDCSGKYGNMGCNGGLMDYGFQYVADNGIELEENYPYTAADGKCKFAKGSVKFENKGFKDVQANSVAQLMAALQNGPVSVAIEADQSSFQFYKSGVLSGKCGTQLDHGVLAVGYGQMDGKDYWKVKNSWGASWGAEGYVYIARVDGAGVCGIQKQPSYPTA